MDRQQQPEPRMRRNQSIIRNGRKSKDLEDNSGGAGKRDVKDVIVDLPKYPKIPSRVLADLAKAGRGCVIKIKAKADYDAVISQYGEDNPMGWKIIHEPSLGHHTMVYYNKECC